MRRYLRLWENSAGIPFDIALRQAPFWCHSVDADGLLVNVSERWAKELGYKPAEMVGHALVDFLLPNTRAAALKSIVPKLEKEFELTDVPYSWQRSDGSILHTKIHSAAITQKDMFIRSFTIVQPADAEHKLAHIRASVLSLLTKIDAENVTNEQLSAHLRGIILLLE